MSFVQQSSNFYKYCSLEFTKASLPCTVSLLLKDVIIWANDNVIWICLGAMPALFGLIG